MPKMLIAAVCVLASTLAGCGGDIKEEHIVYPTEKAAQPAPSPQK